MIYLHMEVPAVFRYDHAALTALDAYFATHPQYAEYHDEHITTELLPALAAYIGEVLVQTQHGQWQVQSTLAQSTIEVDGTSFPVLALADNALRGELKLATLLNNSQ